MRSRALRRGAGRAARAALHGAQRRHPGRRHAGHLGHRRHLSAGPRRRAGRRRSSATPGRCSRGSPRAPLAGVDRSQHLLVLRAGRGAAAAAGGAGRGRRREASRHAARRGGGRDGAAARAAALRRRGPEEILRPARPWFIVLTLRARRCSATCCRSTGVALALRPDFLALRAALLVHPGAALRRRRRRVVLGLLMDVGDATLFGQHALAYAVLAYAAEYFRRRVLRFPLWQQAAQVAVLLALCAALVLLVRFVGGAPLPRWTYAVPPLVGALLWPVVSVAAAVAAAADPLAVGTLTRPGPRDAAMTRRLLFTSQQRRAATAATAARAELAQPGARALPVPPPRWSSPACSSLLAVRRAVRALRLPAGRPARALPDAGRDEPHRDRADRAQPRRDHRPQRRRARAELLGVHAGDPAGARCSNLDETIDALAAIVDIQPRDRKRFRKLLEESKNFESLPLRTRLTDEEVARFAVNRYRFPGVEIKARLFRQYPFGEVASHVDRLHRPHQRPRPRAHRRSGTRPPTTRAPTTSARSASSCPTSASCTARPGVEEVEVDAGGRAVRTLSRTPPIAGNDLRLSLDIRLQEVAEAAFGDRRGALVAIEPATGDVLAFVSRPGFDPNLFVDGIDAGELGAAQRFAGQAAAQPPAARRLSARARRSSRSWRWARSPRASARRRRRSSTPASSRSPARRTASATTSRAATAPSTCTSRSSCPATPTTTCSPTRPTSTTPTRFMSQFGFGRKTGIDIEGELTGVLPSRDWKRQRFAGKNYREEHRKWYLGRQHLRRHRAGLQRVHADPARARDRDDRQRRRRLSARTSCKYIRRHCAPARCAQLEREPTHTVPLKPEHLAVIKNALVGVSTGGHQRARRSARRALRARRQDRHRAGVLAQGREVHGAPGRRAPARPRVVHRLRAGRQADDRARGAGRERRLRRAGRGADRAPGVRLLPDRRAQGRARRRRCRRSRPTPKTRATDGGLPRPGLGGARRAASTAFLFGVAMAIVGVGLVTLFSAADQSLAAHRQPGRRASASRWC